MVPGVSELGGTSLGWGGTHRGVVSSFGCHVATAMRHLVSVSFSWWVHRCLGSRHRCLGSRGLLWALGAHCVVSLSFVVVAVWCLSSSVVVVLSRGLLVGQALSAHQSTMTNDRFESIVRHSVAMSLTATWHLGWLCVSKGRTGGDNLLCMVTTLGVITVVPCCQCCWASLLDDGGGRERRLWIVDGAQIEHRPLLMFAVGVTNPQHN